MGNENNFSMVGSFFFKTLKSSISGASVTVNRTHASNVYNLDDELFPYSILSWVNPILTK